jgi:hypothetical protein
MKPLSCSSGIKFLASQVKNILKESSLILAIVKP